MCAILPVSKSEPFYPQEWWAVLAGGKRLPPTEAKRRQGVDVMRSLFYIIQIFACFVDNPF